MRRSIARGHLTRGAEAADMELSRLIIEVESQRALPSSGVTLGRLMERWVAASDRVTQWRGFNPCRGATRAAVCSRPGQ
jgi:hypothetical protein